MKNIDFLPSRYSERRVARRSHVWRSFVVLLFGAAVASSAICQHWLYGMAKDSLADVAPAHERAKRQTKRLAELQDELKDLRARAMLHVYLQRSWPRSQVLFHALDDLPSSIQLTELTATEEGNQPLRQTPSRRPRRGAGNTKANEEASLSPSLQDLKALRERTQSRQTVVYLAGFASDSAALHAYVTHVNNAPLIYKAELLSTEKVAVGEAVGATRFRVRLLVKDEYGE